MPELSRFLGVVITTYFNDHDPPHFHARYGDGRAALTIDPVALFAGELPHRVLGLVIEWARTHRAELLENWMLLASKGSVKKIPPLE